MTNIPNSVLSALHIRTNLDHPGLLKRIMFGLYRKLHNPVMLAVMLRLSSNRYPEQLKESRPDAGRCAFALNSRGQFFELVSPAAPASVRQNLVLDNKSILCFGGHSKRHRVDRLHTGLINKSIGSHTNAILNVLLNMDAEDKSRLQPNFKRPMLNQLGVESLYAFGYQQVDHDLVTISKYNEYHLAAHPETFYDAESRDVVEAFFLPRIAGDGTLERRDSLTRGPNGLLQLREPLAIGTLHANLRLTFTGYSYGGEFIHMMRNVLFQYLCMLYAPDIILKALQQIVAVISAASSLMRRSIADFSMIKIIDVHDSVVMHKIPVAQYYPKRRLKVGEYEKRVITPGEHIIWICAPFQIIKPKNIQGEIQDFLLENYAYHSEFAYYCPEYFPALARNALITSVMHDGILPDNPLEYLEQVSPGHA